MCRNHGISIIIISSNNPYVLLCIDSVHNQLSDCDELIVVDDHSNEQILNQLNEYQLNKKITLLNSKKKGNRSYNRNLGGRKATKEILLFVDGDIILDDFALQELRRAHLYRHEIAFVGPIQASRFSEWPLKLYSGIDSYLNEIKTYTGRKQIFDNPLFQDKREAFFEDNKQRNFFWLFYYSGFCSVEKGCFDETRGFDETFLTWGGEDVDFGYRISKYGSVGFLPYFKGLHVPHKRDLIKNEHNNLSNIFKMLEKYKVWEFEILATYKATLNLYDNISHIIKRVRLLSLEPIGTPVLPNTIYVNTISSDNPRGNIVYYLDDNERHVLEFIGIKLLFDSDTFNKAFISDNIFIYPPEITSKILQETLRVSKTIYICPSGDCVRISWKDHINFKNLRPQFRLQYNSDDIMDFTFLEHNGMLKVVSKTLYLNQTIETIPNLPDGREVSSLLKIKDIRNQSYCIIDFTTDFSSNALVSFLEKELNIFVLGHYKLYRYKQVDAHNHLLNEIMQFKSSLILLFSDHTLKDSQNVLRLLKTRNNKDDIIIDCQGRLLLSED